MGSERLLSRTAGNQWLSVSPLPAAIPRPIPAIAPRAAVAWRPPSCPRRSGPSRPHGHTLAARQRPRPAGGVRHGDRAGAGLAGAISRARVVAGLGASRPRAAPCFRPGGIAGKPWIGGGRRGGQCQAGGLAFRCPLLGAGRPRCLGVPRLTAAASRQLTRSAFLPAPAPGGAPLPSPPSIWTGEDCFHGWRTGLEQAPGEVES